MHRSKTAPLFDHLTLDRGAMHLKDELIPKYPELVCSGFWFSPEREMPRGRHRPQLGTRWR
jgi:argininosuccinate synthase